MGGKTKRLCKWDKQDYDDKFKKLCKIVGKPEFVCLNCGRVASDKEWLCKPKALDE